MRIKKSILHTIIINVLIAGLFPLFFSCNNGFFANKKLPSPKNLTVSSITSDSAVVSWEAVDNTRVYYIALRAEGYSWTGDVVFPVDSSQDTGENDSAATGRFIISEKNTDNTYKLTLNNLYYDHNYEVEVSAMPYEEDSFEESKPSKTTFKTLQEVIPAGELKRPENVKIETIPKKSTVKISWDAVEGAAFYDINLTYITDYYWEGPDREFEITRTVPASQTFLEDSSMSSLNNVDVIWYRVAARNSDFSDPCRWSKNKSIMLPRN